MRISPSVSALAMLKFGRTAAGAFSVLMAAGRFVELALHAFDDTLDPGFGTAVALVLRHRVVPFGRLTEPRDS
jgi:hypothetical protein